MLMDIEKNNLRTKADMLHRTTIGSMLYNCTSKNNTILNIKLIKLFQMQAVKTRIQGRQPFYTHDSGLKKKRTVITKADVLLRTTIGSMLYICPSKYNKIKINLIK